MKTEENKKQQALNDKQLNEINGGLPRKITRI